MARASIISSIGLAMAARGSRLARRYWKSIVVDLKRSLYFGFWVMKSEEDVLEEKSTSFLYV